jgi:DNA-binding NtrC family response regulator
MPVDTSNEPTIRNAAAGERAWPLDLLGASDAMRRARERVAAAAARAGASLLVVDRGFDVAAIAQEIHARSPGAADPFVALDCTAPDPGGLERALFGGVAVRNGRAAPRRQALETLGPDGCLVRAGRGTLLLTSVTELPASAQARLARVLRDGEARVDGTGGSRPLRLAARIVATAGSSVENDVRDGRLRSELYRRLAAIRIDVPPLSRRREDIPAIARRALREASEAASTPPRTFTQATLALIAALPWEGNLEELRRLLEGLCRADAAPSIRVEDVLGEIRLDARPGALGPQASLREARRQFEREYIAAVLRHYEGRMGPAARLLGIQRTNLYRKARQLGIPRAKASK